MCVVGTSVELECDVVVRFSYFLFFVDFYDGWVGKGVDMEIK